MPDSQNERQRATAAIASPWEIWSAGMESVLRDCGVDVTCVCNDEPSHFIADILPVDLLILDWNYVPRNRGAVFSRPFNEDFEGRIILALQPEDDFTTEDFVAIEVEGLILSTASIQDLAACVESVLRGSRWVDPRVRLLLGHAQHATPQWHDLSGREHEVARLAAIGFSNKKIASSLKLSDGTVKTHMHHILGKLKLGSRFELMQSFNAQRIARSQTEDRSPFESRQRAPRITELVAGSGARSRGDVDRS